MYPFTERWEQSTEKVINELNKLKLHLQLPLIATGGAKENEAAIFKIVALRCCIKVALINVNIHCDQIEYMGPPAQHIHIHVWCGKQQCMSVTFLQCVSVQCVRQRMQC